MQLNIIGLDVDFHAQIINRLETKHGMSSEMAQAVLDDTLKYLHAIAANPGTGLGPSEIIDVCWHELILHTADYMSWCDKAFGHYLHHRPNRVGETGKLIADTAKFMADHGIVFDPRLWGDCDNNCSPPSDNCSRCDPRELVMINADCDGGRGGGPSGCTGPGNCS